MLIKVSLLIIHIIKQIAEGIIYIMLPQGFQAVLDGNICIRPGAMQLFRYGLIRGVLPVLHFNRCPLVGLKLGNLAAEYFLALLLKNFIVNGKVCPVRIFYEIALCGLALRSTAAVLYRLVKASGTV